MHLPAPAASWDPVEMRSTPVAAFGSPLLGSWAAVRWEYARPDGSGRVDVVADLGGAVTLSLSDADYVLSYALRDDETRSAAGALRVVGESWIDLTPRVGNPERVEYRRAAGTLVLYSESSAWDFAGAGEEPAAFTAVLVRL